MYEINLDLIDKDNWLKNENLTNVKDVYESDNFVKFEWEDGELYINKNQIKSFLVKKTKE